MTTTMQSVECFTGYDQAGELWNVTPEGWTCVTNPGQESPVGDIWGWQYQQNR